MRNRPFLQAFLIGIFLPVLYLSLSAAAFGIAEGNGVSALEYSFLSFYFVLFWKRLKARSMPQFWLSVAPPTVME